MVTADYVPVNYKNFGAFLFLHTFYTDFWLFYMESVSFKEKWFIQFTSCHNQGLSNLISEGYASVNNSGG